MRGQRAKQQDWSKPFKMVYSKMDFDDLQTSDDTVINIQTKEITSKQATTTVQKQQIITPQIEIVKRITQVKPFAKVTPNYIRLATHLNVPRVNDYQLTQIDHVFIQTHREKFKLNNGKIVLTPGFLKQVIIALQTNQGKDGNISRIKGSLTGFIEREYRELVKMPNYESFTDLLYGYWRNRREELKFPLFRPLWRPNQDQYNHLLAFKLRQKQKRSLRRSTRTSQDDILQQVATQLSTALKITQRVQLRQQLKQKQLQVQLTLFHQQLKSVFPLPDYIVANNQLITQQTRNKDKEKIKRYNVDVERMRKERQVKNEQVRQPQPTIFDQKESVVNFLATVVAEAESCGLSYERIFHYKGEPQVSAPAMMMLSTSGVVGGMQSIKQLPIIQHQQQQCLNLTLHRAGQYILRGFQHQSDDQSQQSSTQQLNGKQQLISTTTNPLRKQMQSEHFDDVLDFKRRLVTRFYFGEDDQGDYQNLRKNIATSFKKFQLTKQVQ